MVGFVWLGPCILPAALHGVEASLLACYWLFCWVRREFGGPSSRQNSGSKQFGWIYVRIFVGSLFWMRSTLVWKGLPTLLNYDTYFVFWPNGAPRENGSIREKQKEENMEKRAQKGGGRYSQDGPPNCFFS